MIRGGRVIVNTAACIARCCRRCPGPVLRRKCDRFCPQCPTDQIPQGFYRIDLNAFVSPGVTWAQWIAQNDAQLTPCRLIRFGTDPEACYVLDRNCSRCFVPAGCPYVFNYGALPVATFQNPTLATCQQCLACEECCDTAIINDCYHQFCRHCGSTYNTQSSGTGTSSSIQYDTTGGIQRGEISNTTVTRDYTANSTHVCTEDDGTCNHSTMVWKWNGTTRVQVSVHQLTGMNFEGEASASHNSDNPNNPDAIYVSQYPSHCGHATLLRNAIFAQMATGIATVLANTSRDAILRLMPVGTIGDIGLGTGDFSRCSNTVFQQSGGPFEGEYLNEVTYTWSVAISQTGASFTFTYDNKRFVKPFTNIHRALQVWGHGTHSGSFSINRIDPCAPGAVANCPDLLARACGSREVGTGGVGPSGLAGDLL